MFDFLFNTNGRVSRKGYLLAYCLPVMFVSNVLPKLVSGIPVVGLILALINILLIWPALVSVPIKRFHDMGLSAWYQLGFVGLMILAIFILAKGLVGAISPDELTAMQAMSEQQLANKFITIIEDSPGVLLGVALLLLTQFGQFCLFAFVRGQSGANQYGNDPLVSGHGFAD